jgi:hypothetical protein
MRGVAWLAASIFLVLGGGAALADPPDRVGRLSYIEGAVSIRVPGEDQWAPARLNFPVTSGSAIWTEPGAKAEIQVGAAAIRIDQETELDIVRLDDDRMELAVPQGAANIHVPSGIAAGPIWIATATGPVTLSAPGFYSVVDGEVRTLAAPQTPFDQWAVARAHSLAAAQAETLHHVSPDMTGYQDLGAHGSWTVTPDYGAVWYPHAVPVGWAPYRYGYWEYIAPWGWTWIDDTRWGFAPFHYGRWVRVHGRWAWWPGRTIARPVYAPALVVIIGSDGRHHHHHHDRHHRPGRWVPLGPHEHFRPYYRASDIHVRNVNRTTVNNVTVVNNTVNVERLVNRSAATSLPRSQIRAERRERAAAPRSRRDELRAVTAPAPAVAPAQQGEPSRAVARPERRDEDRRTRSRDERRAAPPAVAAPTPPPAVAPSQQAEPRSVVRPERSSEDRRIRNREERRAAPPIAAPAPVTPQPRAPAVTPQAEPPRAVARPERREEERRNRNREERRAAPSPIAAPMSAPPPQIERPRIIRPEAPVTTRQERQEERRNPRETRIAPPVAAPDIRPRLGAPSAPREAIRERERVRPAAQAQPAPARSPQVQQAAPQREQREQRRGDNPQRKRGDGPPPKG